VSDSSLKNMHELVIINGCGGGGGVASAPGASGVGRG